MRSTRRYFCDDPQSFLLLTVETRLSEANDVLTIQTVIVTGLHHGFQWPSVTFPNSASHTPPAGHCCFCERRPTSTSCSSPMSQSGSYDLMSSSSLYFMVCRSLTRSSVHLKYPDFQDPQKTMTFTQKKKKKRHITISRDAFMYLLEVHTPPKAQTR